MGLLDKLQNQGSPLSVSNGGPININPLASTDSKLHANGNEPGYSVNGSNFQLVNSQYQQYIDGVPNVLPKPSQLDRTNITKYLDNLPG